jgi:small subunit ribosomal protein S14
MAKLSQILRDIKREKLIEKYRDRRTELRAMRADPSVSVEERRAAQAALDKLPKNSCPTRLNRRCKITGRARGGYKKFGISRIMLRTLALEGKIPGMRKASW